MTTSQHRLTIQQQMYSWKLTDSLFTVQGAPLVVDPETGKTVDPTDIHLTYGWDAGRGGWFLLAAEVGGSARDEDGSYPDEKSTDVDYYDPVRGEDGEGKAPEWVLMLAAKRMEQLPAVPALPGGPSD